MADNKMTNIAVYRKKTHINIGIIIFGAVFIYLFATVLMYLTNKHVSAYEVREGSIVKDNTYTGFVIRRGEYHHRRPGWLRKLFCSGGEQSRCKNQCLYIICEEIKSK